VLHLDRSVCDEARRSRDARFDGRFFIGVTTTRVYCRPICPARAPNDEHIRYFPTAAAAESAGFRPCRRCRPEASPGTPAWLGTSAVVSRALRLIESGALDQHGVERLADRVGVTARHLRRLFLLFLGASPLDIALARRVHFAARLLAETTLSCTDVAGAAGFGSVRRFNAHVRRTYGQTPREIRRRGRVVPSTPPDFYRLRLAYRPPYDWAAVLGFLAARATPGVEGVSEGAYRRSIAVGDRAGLLKVSHDAGRRELAVEVRAVSPAELLVTIGRVRQMFDLGADPAVIAEHLGRDPWLRPYLREHPGIRTPGAWDGFELGVRAILGQQITVRAATTLAGRVARHFGSACAASTACADVAIDRVFPTPRQLAEAPLEEIGVIRARAVAIRGLAQAILEGRVSFDGLSDPARVVEALQQIPGVGAWTAAYIAMRGLAEPDAFPSGDLILRRLTGYSSARALALRSEAWRPWRAYVVMLLWQHAVDRPAAAKARSEHEHESRQGGRLLPRAAARSERRRRAGAARAL
jgi:AraC family transcriptional regulator of adaptative response / DNA-3-methyladenine glycosylase II